MYIRQHSWSEEEKMWNKYNKGVLQWSQWCLFSYFYSWDYTHFIQISVTYHLIMITDHWADDHPVTCFHLLCHGLCLCALQSIMQHGVRQCYIMVLGQRQILNSIYRDSNLQTNTHLCQQRRHQTVSRLLTESSLRRKKWSMCIN